MQIVLINLLAFSLLLLFRGTSFAGTIEWNVENPFRFFADPAITNLHRQGASPGGSVLAAERLLARHNPHGWAEHAFLETCWDLLRQEHSACSGLDAYVNPRSHRVSARLVGDQFKTSRCMWQLTSPNGRHVIWTARQTQCSEAVRVNVPYPEGGRLVVSVDGTTKIETSLRVADLFIVGLGDSYASGEGNPDRAVRWDDNDTASFGSVPGASLNGYPQRQSVSISYKGRRFHGPSAFWLSQPCHRSLYSHQLRAALQLALEDPHRAVTFLGLSCSGAQITSGLISPHRGVERFPTTPRRSQIGEAAVAQCGGQDFEVRNYGTSFTDGGRVQSLDGVALERCPPRRSRKIDLVFVSIGGNDIGFAKLIAYAILVERSPLSRVSELVEQVATPRQARALFPELESRFKMLRRALHNHLHIPWDEAHRIVLTAYPKIAIERDGKTACGGDNQAGLDGFPGYRLDRKRVASAEAVSAELNALLERISRQFGWSFASEHREQFAGRGICAGEENAIGSPHEALLLPRWSGTTWLPYPPSAFLPYAPRTRWMRTSNDAFMTTHVDLSSDIRRQLRGKQNYEPTDLLKASTFSGAFHPTAEGQAAIADSILPVARQVAKQDLADR